MKIDRDLLEREAVDAYPFEIDTSYPEARQVVQASQAISLKRIADLLAKANKKLDEITDNTEPEG